MKMIYNGDIRVSIIMPNFNKAQFIKESINSCLNQTYENFELIIIDDHSTDNSQEIIKAFANKDGRVKYYLRTGVKQGGNVCRNQGIQNATGEWLIFLDSDDLMEKFCLEQRINCISKYSDVDVGLFTIGTFNQKIGDRNTFWKINMNHDLLISFLKHDLPWHTSSPMWNKKVIAELGGFNENLTRLQDVEFHTRALLLPNLRMKYFENAKPDIFYRVDPGRVSVSSYKFVSNFVEGCIQYILAIKPQLENAGKKEYIKYLNGTLAVAIIRIFHSYRASQILVEERENLIAQVLNNVSRSGGLIRFIVSIFKRIYTPGVPYVPGQDSVLKNILIRSAS